MRRLVSENLLEPALAGRPARIGVARPWRLPSQFYVAFLGGVLAVGALAILNARRLGMTVAQQATIGAAALAGFVAVVVLAASFAPSSDLHLAGRVVAVVAWGAMYLVQRTPDRIHSYHFDGDEPYASLVTTGAALVVGFAVTQIALVAMITGGFA
jgi:hypothetical protein